MAHPTNDPLDVTDKAPLSDEVVPLDQGQRLLSRVRGEFREMPGMRLTITQAQRLWSLDASAAHVVLEDLVSAGFLGRDEKDSYGRMVDGPEVVRSRGSSPGRRGGLPRRSSDPRLNG